MSDIKKDFKLFRDNPDLVYFDSTASSQKPDMVLDWVKNYLESSYANIHRWNYDLSEKSEEFYEKSKKKTAEFLSADSWREVVYTYNSTYALNLLSSSFRRSWILKRWDKVLLSIVEHHANIVPWLILKEEIWIEVDYIKINDDYSLNLEDLKSKLDDKVKVVSMTHVSNVTWQIFDLKSVSEILDKRDNRPFFIVDASQSVPHFKVDVKSLWCDFLFFTAHKVMAEWGIWVLWWKEKLFNDLKPAFSWWWAISYVKEGEFKETTSLPEKWEPWTPNLNWAVSLFYALNYIESIWWYEKVEALERDLVTYTLSKFENYTNIRITWSRSDKNRVWVFSFVIPWIHSHDLADYLAENNICVRAWQHCAEPFMVFEGENNTCRMSLYIYNTKEDIDRFFEVLDEAIKEFR